MSSDTSGTESFRSPATDIQGLENRIKALEAAQQWRPIETAPKDGTRIMLCKQVGYVMAWAGLGYWFNREPCPHHPPCKPGTHTGWTDGLDTYSTPTHWMPVIEVSTSDSGASSDE